MYFARFHVDEKEKMIDEHDIFRYVMFVGDFYIIFQIYPLLFFRYPHYFIPRYMYNNTINYIGNRGYTFHIDDQN